MYLYALIASKSVQSVVSSALNFKQILLLPDLERGFLDKFLTWLYPNRSIHCTCAATKFRRNEKIFCCQC